jgi:hypothetical protein
MMMIQTPDAAAEVDLEFSSFSMEYRKPEWPLTICLPFVDGIRGPVVAGLLYFAKHIDCGFELQGNTAIERARNNLAARFLRSKAEWSFWLDSDVFVPYGNAEVFLKYSGAQKLPVQYAAHNTVARLKSHNQPLVGGVYGARSKAGPLITQPEMQPRSINDTRMGEAIRAGKSAGGLQPVGWLAAGLMLVHRIVFEKIVETQPLKLMDGEEYPFFNRVDWRGEDQAFCMRAIKAGFTPYLDTEVRAGHIGLSIFMPEDTQAPVRMGGR